MSEKKYQVLEGTHVLADSMDLQYALLFMKALCQEYYNMPAYYILQEITEDERV